MKRFLQKVSLSIFSLLMLAAFLELGVRVVTWDFAGGNRLNRAIDLLRSALPAEYDGTLGWAPKPGFSGRDNAWGTQVTIADNGLRVNRVPWQDFQDPVILAVGDSFTFGDQVSDHETWPSYLQDTLQTPVYNGGVFAYGLDQIYLRAEQLVPQLRPDILICSFIREDVFRNELIERLGVQKPYFELDENETLHLRNTPVPPSRERELGWLRKVGGYSVAIDTFMSRFMRAYWLQGFAKETAIHYRGEEVACKLLQRFEELGREYDMNIVLLLQYGINQHEAPYATKLMNRLKECVDREQVTVVDLADSLAALKQIDPERYASLFNVHMTAAGNAFVAEQIAKAVQPVMDTN